jgi:hypothetical protein
MASASKPKGVGAFGKAQERVRPNESPHLAEVLSCVLGIPRTQDLLNCTGENDETSRPLPSGRAPPPVVLRGFCRPPQCRPSGGGMSQAASSRKRPAAALLVMSCEK